MWRVVCAVLFVLLAPFAAHAQEPTPTVPASPAPAANAAIARISTQGSTASTISVFAPGDPIPRRKQEIAAGITVAFSPDSQWVVTYGRAEGNPAPLLTYARVGQEPVRITLETGYSTLFVHFSADSRYFCYTVVSYTAGRWVAASVELGSGQAIRFSGKHDFGAATPQVSGGFPGVAEIVAWHNNDKRLVVAALQFGTNSGERFAGLYAVDLSKNPANYDGPMLPAQPILSGEKIVGMPLIAPDGTKAAYFTIDPANPPENYAAKESLEPNTLTVINLLAPDDKDRVRVQAGKGQAITLAVWLPDSKRLLYSAGSFKNTLYAVAARTYTLDVTTRETVPGGVIEPDAKQYVFSMLACEDTLFFVSKVYKPDFSGLSTLYSAPLHDVSARSKTLASGQNIALLGCTPIR